MIEFCYRHWNFNSYIIQPIIKMIILRINQSIGNNRPEVLVLYDRMLAQNFHLVHLYHALNSKIVTAVTFYQDAAPLMLFKTGEDSAKEVPFFTSWMNFRQFMYMYQLAYLSIRLAQINVDLRGEQIQGSITIRDLSTQMLLRGKAGSGSHLAPRLRGYLLAKDCIAAALFS